MSGLFATLNATSTALDAQSQAISVTSNNIANINNPNYSRETVIYNDLGSVETPDGVQSTGVTTTVEQMRSAVLDQMVRQQGSITDGYTASQNVLQQAQAALGEDITNSASSGSSTSTVSTSGLSSAISSFFDSVQALASDPTNSGDMQTVVQQGGVLTDRMQEVDQNLAQIQSGADAQASSDVTSANGLLQQVAQLNSQIASLEQTNPGSALNLRDQREGDLEQLAGYLPISVTEDSHGEDTVTTTDQSGATVTLVQAGTVQNSLNYSAGTLSAGTTPDTLTPSSGSISGTISAAYGAVQDLRTSLNQLAQQIVTSVNQAYNPGGTTGGNFFDATGTTAATMALDSHLNATDVTVGTGAPGDNSIALAVANVANQSFSTGGGDAIDGTISGYYGTAVSNIGQALDTVNTQVDDETNVQTIIQNQRESLSGVSVDEEMSNLMTYQRAFQASSEVFQVIDSLLDTVVTGLGTLSS